MKRGDIVAFISERTVVHARIFDWNGNLQSHLKVVDGLRRPYKVYPWQCYGAEEFSRDGRVLMTEAQAQVAAAETAFLQEKHERDYFRRFFAARPESIRHQDGRVTHPGRSNDYARILEHPTEHGRLERWDLPTDTVQLGMGRGTDASEDEKYVCQVGLTQDRQMEEYLHWIEVWEPRERRALELLRGRSEKQAQVWLRCVKGDWRGQTESQVALAREWGVSKSAVTQMKQRAHAFMESYVGIDPRRFYASYDERRAA